MKQETLSWIFWDGFVLWNYRIRFEWALMAVPVILWRITILRAVVTCSLKTLSGCHVEDSGLEQLL